MRRKPKRILLDVHQVASYVVTETGGVACATVSGTLRRIRTAAAVLDEGAGIDPGWARTFGCFAST